MAKTPVAMKIDGYKDREVLKVTYEFEQETDAVVVRFKFASRH